MLNKNYSNLFRDNISHDNNFEYVHNNYGFKYSYKNFPIYLTTIIERQGQNIDWLESEFHYDLEGLSGIAVINTKI